MAGAEDPGDSRSSSLSSEGIESEDIERYDDKGAAVLPLVILHESPSYDFPPSSLSGELSRSGGLCRMLHDLGLELDKVCLKSSKCSESFLMFLPDSFLRTVKLVEFCTEATANSAAMDGGMAFGS